MRILLPLLAAALLSPSAVSQEIYKWVDKDGVVHYSDQPGPGAERITVTGHIANPPDESQPAPLYSSPPSPSPQGEPLYRMLEIVQPGANEVFFGADATITVELALDAELRPGDSVMLFLNGRQVPMQGLSTTLAGIARGSYSLRAAVLGRDGSTLLSSSPLTFHVRQPSVASPPVGPALRGPAPQPQPRPGTPPANRG